MIDENVGRDGVTAAGSPGAVAVEARDAFASLKAEISSYANAVDRVRDLVKALRVASEAEEVAPVLYWPHLLAAVEAMFPEEDGLDRAMIAMYDTDALPQAS